jgi:hypothetical protein
MNIKYNPIFWVFACIWLIAFGMTCIIMAFIPIVNVYYVDILSELFDDKEVKEKC